MLAGAQWVDRLACPSPMLKPVALLNPRPQPARDQPGLPDWVLPYKLDPPQVQASAIARHALLRELEQAQALPLTLLLAPPGFGKTTLLAQWHRHLQERGAGVAWLSLDDDDTEVERFLGHLALALQSAGAEPSACAQLLQQPCDAQTCGAAVNLLIRAIHGAPHELTVLLDDYERASCALVDDVVLRLVEHAGPRLHLVVATRRAPALPLARLGSQGRLARLGSGQLALDAAETLALLGAEVPEDVALELRRSTEGWPVALHLARLWLARDAAQRPAQMARFSGRSAEIAAYLAEQVVNDLDAATRDFLLRTAPLERFDGALADHVRGSTDSGLLLTRLERFHGLLVPLDDEHAWFRYHPLFADYLQQQLERERPGELQQVHQRAARWLGEHGHLAEAVRHAARGGAGDLAAGYIARAGTWQLLLRHGPAQVRTLLRHFDHRTIRDTPALNLTQAYLHMKLGEFAHARLLLERFRDFPAAMREPFQRDYTVVVALLRDLFDEICGNPHGRVQIAAQAAALDEDDHLGRGTLACICATTALGQADFAAAERHALAACEDMRRCGSEIGVNYALLHLGQSRYYRGALDEAEAAYQQAMQLAQRHEHTDRTLQAAASCLLAQLQYERGRHDQAADLLESSLSFLEQHDGWLDLFASGYETALGLAKARDRSGRGALALLDHIDAIAQARHLARLSELAVAWRLQVVLDLPAHAGADLLIARAGGEAGLAHALRHAHHWRQRAALGFALARWHGLAGRTSAALAILRQLEEACTAEGNQHHRMRAHIRMALVLQQRGELDDALPHLHSVLDHVALTHSWQVVAELGLPAKAMLRSLRQHDPEIVAGTTRALTIQALLDRLSGEEDALSEDFSERELEVLAQLAGGHSNKQIGRNLHLSENTVKFHLKNLYRKLDARTREAALANALQRGVLRGQDNGPLPLSDA
ncbi:transcriptional regulator [[Pseudomonas] boreopolis]|uniref:Transcriptional regulator n=2 Tax=Xanthomonas boreopolis TaxID=86183 RepID=A0A919KH38_9XANT|nr:transcriptional regulator [[Pseudomonas] boreopolis]